MNLPNQLLLGQSTENFCTMTGLNLACSDHVGHAGSQILKPVHVPVVGSLISEPAGALPIRTVDQKSWEQFSRCPSKWNGGLSVHVSALC